MPDGRDECSNATAAVRILAARRSCLGPFRAACLGLAVLLVPQPAGGSGDRVRPDESLESLLAGEPGSAIPSESDSATGGFFRATAAVALVAAAALGALWLWRRRRPARGLGAGSLLEVLARAPLSPRHGVYLLRVGEHKVLVLGVSGDRISPLGSIDAADGAAELLARLREDVRPASRPREAAERLEFRRLLDAVLLRRAPHAESEGRPNVAIEGIHGP